MTLGKALLALATVGIQSAALGECIPREVVQTDYVSMAYRTGYLASACFFYTNSRKLGQDTQYLTEQRMKSLLISQLSLLSRPFQAEAIKDLQSRYPDCPIPSQDQLSGN